MFLFFLTSSGDTESDLSGLIIIASVFSLSLALPSSDPSPVDSVAEDAGALYMRGFSHNTGTIYTYQVLASLYSLVLVELVSVKR